MGKCAKFKLRSSVNLKTMPNLFTSFFHFLINRNYRRVSITKEQLLLYFKMWWKIRSYLYRWGSYRSPASHHCIDSSVKDPAKPTPPKWSPHAHHHRSQHPKIFHTCVQQKVLQHAKNIFLWQYIHIILGLPTLILWHRGSNH